MLVADVAHSVSVTPDSRKAISQLFARVAPEAVVGAGTSKTSRAFREGVSIVDRFPQAESASCLSRLSFCEGGRRRRLDDVAGRGIELRKGAVVVLRECFRSTGPRSDVR